MITFKEKQIYPHRPHGISKSRRKKFKPEKEEELDESTENVSDPCCCLCSFLDTIHYHGHLVRNVVYFAISQTPYSTILVKIDVVFLLSRTVDTLLHHGHLVRNVVVFTLSLTPYSTIPKW